MNYYVKVKLYNTAWNFLKTIQHLKDIWKIRGLSKGNANGAFKLLTNSLLNGTLPLSHKTLDLLKQKHPEPEESSLETLLQNPFRPIRPVAYDDIKESFVRRAAMLTKGCSGPSSVDADGCRRILISRLLENHQVTFVKLLKTSSRSFIQKNYNPHSPLKLSQPTDWYH